jgi:hypothetical protein
VEKSLSKKSRVVQEYVNKKAGFPTAYFGPDNKTLSSLPDYGRSNAALPRGEDPSVIPYKETNQNNQKETKMSNKRELAKLAREIREVKAQLNKSSGRKKPVELSALAGRPTRTKKKIENMGYGEKYSLVLYKDKSVLSFWKKKFEIVAELELLANAKYFSFEDGSGNLFGLDTSTDDVNAFNLSYVGYNIKSGTFYLGVDFELQQLDRQKGFAYRDVDYRTETVHTILEWKNGVIIGNVGGYAYSGFIDSMSRPYKSLPPQTLDITEID